MVSSKLILDFLVISSNRIKARNKTEKKRSLNTHTSIKHKQGITSLLALFGLLHQYFTSQQNVSVR